MPLHLSPFAWRNQFKRWARQRRNLGQLTEVGADAELWGEIERRAPGAQIRVGRASRIEGLLVAETNESRLRVGNNSLVGSSTVVDCALEITIEDDVLISYQCIIADSNNHSLDYEKRKDDLVRWREGRHDWSDVKSKPVRICKGAWIGARSIILKGVTVGEGAIVGMGSVVTDDVAPYTAVVGNPARVVRELRS